MSPFHQFLWGLVGSVAVDILDLNQMFQVERVRVPGRFKCALYWFVRLCLAAVGGGIAVAYDVQTPMLALNLGATAPLVIGALSKRRTSGVRVG